MYLRTSCYCTAAAAAALRTNALCVILNYFINTTMTVKGASLYQRLENKDAWPADHRRFN